MQLNAQETSSGIIVHLYLKESDLKFVSSLFNGHRSVSPWIPVRPQKLPALRRFAAILANMDGCLRLQQLSNHLPWTFTHLLRTSVPLYFALRPPKFSFPLSMNAYWSNLEEVRLQDCVFKGWIRIWTARIVDNNWDFILFVRSIYPWQSVWLLN